MKRTNTGKAIVLCIIVLALLVFEFLSPVFAQPSAPEPTVATPEAFDDKGASQFGGPNSVGGTLKKDKEVKTTVLIPYFDFKEKVKKNYGLAFGLDYNALFQAATASPGDDTAASGALRFFGRWTLLGRGSGNTGTLIYKVENRHRLGTDIAPQDLGSEVGYAGLTAVPFSDMGWALTNLFWEQQLLNGRLAFVAGVVDSTDYVDTYSLLDSWTDFNNLAFTTNPTIPAPNQGLGAAVSAMITDNYYVLVGLADANGDPTNPGDSFSSFFDDAEYFSHLEVGWIQSRKNRFTDSVHLTVWHADARVEAQLSSGWGMAFSWNRLFENTWEPFVRAGYSDGGGALWNSSVSIGLGYHTREKNDLVALGLSWGRPSEEIFGPGLNDQYTAELFYRLKLSNIITITPDVQLLVDPALNPDEDVIAIFGIRARLSF
jgi:porin